MSCSTAVQYSFIVVGCGPVGAVTALLLAASDRSVLVVESDRTVYPLPRAVHIDAHSARILASILPASVIGTLVSPMQHCTFTDARGRQLVQFTCKQHCSHGVHSDFIIDQPALERALRTQFAAYPNITFVQGDTVTDVHERADGEQCTVHVTTASGHVFSADYLLACDGARSTVRSLLNILMLSLDLASSFASTHWWVVDGLMCASVKQRCGLTHHGVTQVCDGARPITIVNLPGDRVRVEVRRKEKDSTHVQQAHNSGAGRWWQRVWDTLCYLLLVAWSTIAPLVSSSWSAWKVQAVATPLAPPCSSIGNEASPPPLDTLLPRCIPLRSFSLVRCAAYTIHSLIAASFLSPSRRFILLGDAAHLSPPYLGQALCLGIRDAASLAFRLALSTPARPCELSEWEAERRAEATEIIVRSGKVGQLLSISSSWQCWLRDVVMRAVDNSAWMKAAFQADVAVYGRVLYAAGRRRLIVWPEINDSHTVLLHRTAISIIGIDCDARQLTQPPDLTLHRESSAATLHFVRLNTRDAIDGVRWREWFTSMGLRGAGVAVSASRSLLAGHIRAQTAVSVEQLSACMADLCCSPSCLL